MYYKGFMTLKWDMAQFSSSIAHGASSLKVKSVSITFLYGVDTL